MAYEQTRAYCNSCRRNTLHSRNTHDVPHTFHLLMTFMCCGFWLFIWLLHGLSVSMGSQPPFLCSRCGMEMGELTERQIEEMEEDAAWEAEQRRKRRRRQMRELGLQLDAAIRKVYAGIAWLLSPLRMFFDWCISVPDDWRNIDERAWQAVAKTLACILVPFLLLTGFVLLLYRFF